MATNKPRVRSRNSMLAISNRVAEQVQRISAAWNAKRSLADLNTLPPEGRTEELLRLLVAYRTVSDDFIENTAALDFIEKFVAKRGMYTKRFIWDGFGALIATTQRGSKKPKVMLAAHVDVMAAPEEMFTLQKADGKLFGRGVLDMKVAIAAYLHVIDDLADTLHDYDFGLMITTDEEIGGRDGINGVKRFIEEGYRTDALILPDGGKDWQIETFAKGFVHFTLESHGKTAHGSRPWEGDNAAFKLINALHEIREHFKDHGPETDTLNIGVIQGGELVNKIPDYARAEIEMRISKTGGVEFRKDYIEKICRKHDIKHTLRTGWDPIINPLDNPYVYAYAECTKEVTGIENIGFKSYGGSDARFVAPLGIPYANAYPTGGGHHSSGEWLDEKAPYQLKQIVQKYLERIARTTA